MADILRLIRDTPERSAAVALTARRHVKSNFSLQIRLDKLWAIYESLASESRR
jgi:hypothetical protein